MFLSKIYLISYCLAIVKCITFVPLQPTEKYTHSAVIDDLTPENYKIYWKVLNETDEIQFEIHCKSTGWVGLGISPNGGMKGADVLIGWVGADGRPQLRDTYATGNSRPLVDRVQNWDLLDGHETDGYTILKIKRKLDTCDPSEDMKIQVGTTYGIFAWNYNDPQGDQWLYHGTKNRLTKALLLLNYQNDDLSEQGVLPAETSMHDFRMRNVELKAKSTYYYCDAYELPKFNETVHLIQFEMLISESNRHLVHHLLAYECDNGFDASIFTGRECGSAGLGSNAGRFCQNKLFVAWGIGGQYNYTFPKQAGYPLFPSNRTRYIMIELHYDNPQLLSGVRDDSGVRLYYTKTLREHDLGLLMFGVDGSFQSIMVPAYTDQLTVTSTCFANCSQKFVPDEGIYIVSSLLHTHLAGRSVKTSLVRNDEIIRVLFDNPNYDFNYQYIIDIEPTKVLKGDVLINECKFNTQDRNNFTFFGFGTYDEMCYSFMYYYPRIPNLVQCISSPSQSSMQKLKQSIRALNLSGTPTSDNDGQWYFYMRNKLESSPEVIQLFKEFFDNGHNQFGYCGADGSSGIVYPDEPFYRPKGNAILVKQCEERTTQAKETTAASNLTTTFTPTKVLNEQTTKSNGSKGKNLFKFVILSSLILILI